MITESQYRELKRSVESARQEADRAKGAVEELLSQLREEHGCQTMDKARKVLARVQKEAKALEAQLEEAVEQYQQKWNVDENS